MTEPLGEHLHQPRPRRAKAPIIIVAIIWPFWLACVATSPSLWKFADHGAMIVIIVFTGLLLVYMTWMVLSRRTNRSSASR